MNIKIIIYLKEYNYMANDKNGLVQQLQILIQDEINQLPKNVRCTVRRAYEDNKHVDIELDIGGTVDYVEFIGTNRIGADGVILFLNQDVHDYIVVTDTYPEIRELREMLRGLQV